MRRLFLPRVNLCSDTVAIEGADYHHLVHVLRVQAGETLLLLDNVGGAVRAEIIQVEKRRLTARILGPVVVAPEPPVHITVAQAIGKGDKFEQVVQHATEAGASAFIPLLTERAVLRMDAKEVEAKRARWSLIAKGAAEQAGRARIPDVHPVVKLPALLNRLPAFQSIILLHPEGERLFQVLSPSPLRPVTPSPFLLVVGPEGGFTPGEVERAREMGARIVSLGPYTLRTETAALVAVSQVLYDTVGRMGG